jgi:hypothetical protein
MSNLVSQSAFARLKNVSGKTVSEWKTADLLVFSGKSVDVAATQAKLLTYSSHRAKGRLRPVTQPSTQVAGDTPQYANGAAFDNPANLPDEVCITSSMIEGGAYEMARLLAQHLPLPATRAMVGAWVETMRDEIVGGPGLLEAPADMDWPAPPIGLAHWREHPYFQGDALGIAEWEEIKALAAVPLPAVGNDFKPGIPS